MHAACVAGLPRANKAGGSLTFMAFRESDTVREEGSTGGAEEQGCREATRWMWSNDGLELQASWEVWWQAPLPAIKWMLQGRALTSALAWPTGGGQKHHRRTPHLALSAAGVHDFDRCRALAPGALVHRAVAPLAEGLVDDQVVQRRVQLSSVPPAAAHLLPQDLRGRGAREDIN